jgi:hypothetical protein
MAVEILFVVIPSAVEGFFDNKKIATDSRNSF